ncbi:MAG: hypothetical protein V1735_05325 [Nanoarchaeota archaeon]
MKKEHQLLLLLVAVALMLAIPLAIRAKHDGGLLIGPEPYLALAHRELTAFSLLILAGEAIGPEHVVRFLPGICLLAVALVSYTLIRKRGRGHRFAIIAIGLFAFSSAAIAAGLRFGETALHFALATLALHFFLRRKAWPVSILFLSVIAWSNPASGLITLVSLFAFSVGFRRLLRFCAVLILPALTILLRGLHFPQVASAESIVADFGSVIGISLFAILAGIGGLVICWRRREKLSALYLFLAITLVAFRFWPVEAMLFLAFSFALFGAFAVERLFSMRWQLQLIKSLTLITFACGILFSALVSIQTMTAEKPTPEMVQSYLQLHRLPPGIVLSYSDYSPFVNFFSGKGAVPEEAGDAIFYAQEFQDTVNLLQQQNVSYIWIDTEMRHGLVWDNEEQGLLYMLRNNVTFKKIYNRSGIEIWTVNASAT